jgi:hypothetical protein
MYTQTEPLIQTSKDNTVNIFWLDGRGPKDLVMGTRTWGPDTVSIYWAKETAERENPVPTGLRINAPYPNPISLSTGSVSNLLVEVLSDCQLSLKLYDNLGRQVAVMHEGFLNAGRHAFTLDVSGLPTGLYTYILRGLDEQATRGLVVVK